MTTLRDIGRVEQNITKVPVKAVRVLHHMIFGREGDWQNRKRLKQFRGFTFDVNTDEYRNKILELEGFKIIWQLHVLYYVSIIQEKNQN